MTLQTDLQEAIARIQADTLILHNIVHGNNTAVVTTEGGPVKSAAKTIKDIQDSAQAVIDSIVGTGNELNEILDQAHDYRDEAHDFAQDAQLLANSLNLPTNLTGLARMMLAVKQDESGYEPVSSISRFYGIKKVGSKLIAESGDGTFNAADYVFWFITLPGVSFTLSASGHLQIVI